MLALFVWDFFVLDFKMNLETKDHALSLMIKTLVILVSDK